MSLFDKSERLERPLAERLRPQTLGEYLGQSHLLADGSALRQQIAEGKAGSLLLFGPPGVGKTTLALLIAKESGLHFEPFSAVLGGVKEVRAAVARAGEIRARDGQGTLLFVDEIHRFNKAQQDAFLPYVESGEVVLVGATTENPSFSVIAPLLSRCRVLRLEPLDGEALGELLQRALQDAENGLGDRNLSLTDEAAEFLVGVSGGDGRRALTVLEAAATTQTDGATIDAAALREAAQHRTLQHDRAGDLHYDLLSAFHKSLRNSDVDASVYWLARMLATGADPLQPARRMLAMAAEDIGLADPMALQVATSALVAVQNLGLPEGRLPLAEAAIYLAAAPKSNAVYRAIADAMRSVEQDGQPPVPLHLRNAPTKLAKEWGHGQGYQYAHDQEDGVAAMQCLPDQLADRRFFKPGDRGFEAKVKARIAEAKAHRRR